MLTPAFVLVLALGPAGDPAPAGDEPPLPHVRRVVAHLTQAAAANRQRPRPLDGDALADHLVRAAADLAGREDLAPAAVLVGLAVGLDRTDLLRDHPLTGPYWKRIEDDGDRRRRLAVLGRPTLKGRADWLQHFAVSAALAALTSSETAEEIGLAKELLDARGGTGFSFADLAADYAGVRFAQRVLAAPAARLRTAARSFRGDDHLPDMRGLEEGLSLAGLQAAYGGPNDPRFDTACRAVRARVDRVEALAAPPPGKQAR